MNPVFTMNLTFRLFSVCFSRKTSLLGLISLFFALPSLALGDTDTITWGGDNSRAGYQPNHNMDPNVVASPNFGQIFKTQLPGNFGGIAGEQVFSQPLVYTGGDGVQHVFVATTQNNIYKLDAKTGAIVNSRNLHVPFLTADLDGCVDINPLIGVTATGVIDSATGIWYLSAKTYTEEFQHGNFGPLNPPGRLNGRYWQHAIRTEDLSEADNWPIPIEGITFRNNPNRMFLGGNQHSRPGALLVGDYIYTGYASHCVQYNVTGAIIGFHKTTGKIVEVFATQGGPEPNTVKGGGVWMSGGGLAYDGRGSMYFSTGNGYASQLKATGNSVPGRSPPTALEEAAVNAKINEDGTLTIIDFFMPWEKTQLDGADKDLGTTPLEILPSEVFSCPNHRRIGVVTGKSGKTYWLDLDNLGGYQNGPDKLDAVIQVFQNENSVYAGAGVLPLSGGYIYISVTQYPTHVFQFSCSAAGNAVFTKITDTPDKNAYILGTGHGTTTSLNGQEGTGLLWTSDVQGQNLRIYDPIPPQGGGPLTLLKAFNIPGVTKFTRPVFGDGRVYVGTTQGYFYGFGSPINVPINCSSPYSFGSIEIGNVSDPLTVTCTALVATTITNITLNGAPNFNISDVPSVPFDLASERTFSFKAVSHPRTFGPQSSDVLVETKNTQPGYSISTTISLRATGRSSKPVLAIAPNTISFNAIAGQPSSMQSSLFWNHGDSLLTFSNISFSLVSEKGPWISPNNTADGKKQVGEFLFVDLPSTIQSGSSTAISIIYAPDVTGTHSVFVKAFSDGGDAVLDVFGVAGTYPKAVIEFQAVDGSGWVPYIPGTPFSFGTVYEAQVRNLLLRVTNGGGPSAVPLSITVSKPPFGIQGLIGKANNVDLAEGTSIAAEKSQTAVLYCSAPKMQVNTPSYNGTAMWTLNTGDPILGKQIIQFFCNAAAEQVGQLFPNGTAQYGYVGCFKENNPGRQLATNVYSDTKNNTNDRCINACFIANYTFAGTQYSQECWCGNAIPIQKDLDRDCNFGCTGDRNQTCGGDGYLHDTSHISLFADSTKFDGNTTSPPLQITPNVGIYSFVGCYADTAGRTLSDKSTTSNVMTVQACASFCSSYPYFGLEFSSECYCGSKLNAQSTSVDPKLCNAPCKGSNSQYCGGSAKMQIYQANGPLPSPSSSSSTEMRTSNPKVTLTTAFTSTPKSFVTVSVSTSTSPKSSTPSPSGTTLSCPTSNGTMYTTLSGATYLIECGVDYQGGDLSAQTIYVESFEDCIDICDKYSNCSYSTFVRDSGGACYPKSLTGAAVRDERILGAKLISGAQADSSTSSMPPLSLWVSSSAPFSDLSAQASPSISAPISTAPTATSTSSSTFNPQPSPSLPAVGSYTYTGCYIDPFLQTGTRALTGLPVLQNSTYMTPSLCAAYCTEFAYFGLEYSRECWCGPHPSVNSTLSNDQSDCNMPCTGDASRVCGGNARLSIYRSSDKRKVSQDPVVPRPDIVGGQWKYLGCFVDTGSPRILVHEIADDAMSTQFCLTAAETEKYMFAGLEFGRECWMGNELRGNNSQAGNVQRLASECKSTCGGAKGELCGGSARINLWTRNGTGA